MKNSIQKGTTVTVIYDLYVDDIEDSVEEVTSEDPLVFKFGEEDILEALEDGLLGKSAGDKFEIKISSDKAYGPEREDLYIELKKSDFLTEEGLDEMDLEEGEVVPLEDDAGNEVFGIIVENKLNTVIIDCNHPLAGENLVFRGEVISAQ